MPELFLVILRLLFPLDPVRQAMEIVRRFLGSLIGRLESEYVIDDLTIFPAARIELEMAVGAAEDTLRMLVEQRARQIARLPFFVARKLSLRRLYRARSLPQLFIRLQHVLALHDRFEPLAQPRAARLLRAIEADPLGLAVAAPASAFAAAPVTTVTVHTRALSRIYAPDQRIRAPPEPERNPEIRNVVPRSPPARTRPHARNRTELPPVLFFSPSEETS